IPALAYGSELIRERHRHRFEFNDEYRTRFEQAGLECVGENPETGLVEVVQVSALTWYVGTQYHPEYQSTVLYPNPLFQSFVKAAIAFSQRKSESAL
ncbi:MAG: CTP synthase, partial [Muribaculaceae bacterium]|nr:CTP synthase [Muribaculaceae bacterium]